MKIRTLKVIRLPSGRVPVGSVFEMADHQALFHLERGEVERFVGNEAPTAGEVQPSFVSPVAPALTQTTPEQSSDGAKKRGRPRKNPAE
jgi:hypothetical protein